jgi:hypothetical protein
MFLSNVPQLIYIMLCFKAFKPIGVPLDTLFFVSVYILLFIVSLIHIMHKWTWRFYYLRARYFQIIESGKFTWTSFLRSVGYLKCLRTTSKNYQTVFVHVEYVNKLFDLHKILEKGFSNDKFPTNIDQKSIFFYSLRLNR